VLGETGDAETVSATFLAERVNGNERQEDQTSTPWYCIIIIIIIIIITSTIYSAPITKCT